MALTPGGKGIVTTTASSVGALELPLLALPNEKGVVLEVVRLGAGFEACEMPGKFVFNVKRASKSVLDLDLKSTVTGRNTFSARLGGSSRSSEEGIRSDSYPASMNFPSGGTNESSPGRSFHLARRTQGWNTGICIVLDIPEDLSLLVPPGADKVSDSSGTPDILAVNNIEPLSPC